jgi:hypothetical protein
MRQQQQTGTINKSQTTKLSVNSRIRFNQNKNLTKINRVNRVNNPKIGFKNKTKCNNKNKEYLLDNVIYLIFLFLAPKIKNLRGKVQTAGLRQSFG